MIGAIVIRPATDEDSQEIAEVSSLAVADLRRVYRPTLAAIAEARRKPVQRLVAVVDGRVVGAVKYLVQEQCLHVMGPMVLPSHRRRGVARKLFDSLADIARDMGLTRLSLVTITATGNVATFQKLGFAVVSESTATGIESATGEALREARMERLLTV